MNLGVVSSASFVLAVLIRTSDGGKTWELAPGGSGTAGEICFLNSKAGWVAGDPDGEQLFATADGANSWTELSLTAPGDASLTPHYDLPTFEAEKSAYLPVTYSGTAGSGLTVVLFSSNDAGQTWKANRTLPHLPEVYGGVPFRTSVADSTLIAAYVSNRTNITLISVDSDGRVTSSTVKNAVAPNSAVKSITFITHEHGWALGGELLSTNDSGSTWRKITPQTKGGTKAQAQLHLQQLRNSAVPGSESIVLYPQAGLTSRHVGFDRCTAHAAQIVGYYEDQNFVVHGFVATPD